ncbi:18016_t:CDS:2 [Dentiscutata erythropus]|uniref:18016_t:CDS:1 n=1 Tax=Dentiscutata erythropus TaxID=1348616 RepID=A0A9N9ERW7_9GLOM|nr:18016_t:CDS:2 [Dentiscutata erythropus]
MVLGNRAVVETWIIFQFFNVIPLCFLFLQFLHKGKHYTIACLSITTIFDCIISVPVALQYYFINQSSITSTPQNTSTTNDSITTDNDTETSPTMLLIALDGTANIEPICIAQAYALYFIELSIGFWIFCLMINMWLLLVKATSDIEAKWFKVMYTNDPILRSFCCLVFYKTCWNTTNVCRAMALMSPHINAYFNTILAFGLFLIFGTTQEALRSLLLCICLKPIFRKRSSIASFVGSPEHNSMNDDDTSAMAVNGEDDDIEMDSEMEISIVEPPPSTFGNLKRTTSFSKYKIGDDVLKFEEIRWGNVFRNYSIGRNGRHNYGGNNKSDKNGGDNSTSAINSAINSVKSFKSFKSFNRFLEIENKITVSLTNNDQINSDILSSTPPPPPIPFMQPKTPGSMRN